MKTTKKQRRLPEGWRRLTPTEKIDANTRAMSETTFIEIEKYTTNAEYWVSGDTLAFEIGRVASKIQGWIYIKPKKSYVTIKTPPSSTPATT